MEYTIPIKIAGIYLKNPLIVASGFLGLSQLIFNRLYNLGAGAIVSKSISLLPREGYKNPTIVPIEGNSYINAVGLANPGLEDFSKEISNNDVPLFVSIVGSTFDDFPQIINKLKNFNILGFELNLSCPHVEKMGMEIGDDPNAVFDIVKTIKNNSNKPLFVKVGIGNSDILKTAKVAEEAGADGITAINTIRAMKIDTETGYPILENRIGGLSGASIKPIGVRCVYELKRNINIPIIGCGGILSYYDVIEYLMAGASAVQIGSILGLEGLNSFNKILEGLYKYLKVKSYKDISELIGIAQRY
ncbi:MAG: dihydroorotate dehydrogenase [Thermoproteota archaeon]|nr:dihydroorotate dehydrogenase [Thermoproteota archaeon]